jgi:hypothetical protein
MTTYDVTVIEDPAIGELLVVEPVMGGPPFHHVSFDEPDSSDGSNGDIWFVLPS